MRAWFNLADTDQDADWPRIKEAARQAQRYLTDDLPALLDLLEAAASFAAREASKEKRQGRVKDAAREDFVLAAMRVFQAATGREGLRISKNAMTGERGGPAARFLAAVCDALLSRLHPQELAEAPTLADDLRRASDTATAASWIEQARPVPG